MAADAGVLRPEPAWWAAAHGLAAGALARRAPRLRAACAALVALAAGAAEHGARLEAARRELPRAPFEARVEGRVAAVRRGTQWMRVDLREVARADARAGATPSGPSAPAVPRGVRVLGPRTPPELPAFEAHAPGTRVRARLRLRPALVRRNPGAGLSPRALARRGLAAEARLAHPALHVALGRAGPLEGPRRALARARRRAAERLRAHGPGGALLAALATGERAGLPERTRRALARLGLAHLLAVSGLHLALVAALAFGAARRLWARLPGAPARADARRVALGPAVGLALAYALFAGWGVPVRRALVFLAAAAGTAALRRPAPRAQPLALAALLLLAADSATLFSAGAQLSFAASAALLASGLLDARDAAGPGEGAGLAARTGAAAERIVRAGATASAATAPIVAWHFGVASPLAGLANLVAIPATAFLLLPSALLAAGMSAVAPDALLAEAVRSAAAGPAGAALAAAERAAEALPPAAPLPPPRPLALAGAAALAAATLRARRTTLRVLLALAVPLLLRHAPPLPVAPSPPRAVFLDVGQGDATLVQGRRGAVLVDAARALPGGADLGRRTVLPALAALGVERLDLLAVTHGDLDHRGGASAVLESLPVGRVWLPPGGRSDPALHAVVAAARARGVPVEERAAGDPPLRAGDLGVRALGPPRAAPARGAPVEDNDRSLVLRVEAANGRRVLLPGDITAAAERRLRARGADLRADVLKLPHHGSRSSATRAFLEATRARVAVASAACLGPFAMPHPDVVRRARRAGQSVWWTGRHGAVLVALGPRLVAWGHGPLQRCAPSPTRPRAGALAPEEPLRAGRRRRP